jgi:hypothetical protein
LTTSIHNQQQASRGENRPISLWRNGFHNQRRLRTTE